MDDKIYSQLKNKWKSFISENYILDELSIAGDLQNEPSWNNPSYNKNILKNKAIHIFRHDFKDLGIIDVGMFKDENSYVFLDLQKNEKIAEIDFKKINILYSGKIHNNVETDYKVTIISTYRNKGFSYPMYDCIIKYNTSIPGVWVSDTKLTPVNKIVWEKLIKKYDHEYLISNGRTPALWIPINDKKNIEKYNLNYQAQKIVNNPNSIWEEKFDGERIRILLKA